MTLFMRVGEKERIFITSSVRPSDRKLWNWCLEKLSTCCFIAEFWYQRWADCISGEMLMLILRSLHEKFAVRRGIWVPNQHLPQGRRKSWRNLVTLFGRRPFRVHIHFQHAVQHSSRGISAAATMYDLAVFQKHPDVFYTDLFNVCFFRRNSLSDISRK